jgi:ribose transport system permease protein
MRRRWSLPRSVPRSREVRPIPCRHPSISGSGRQAFASERCELLGATHGSEGTSWAGMKRSIAGAGSGWDDGRIAMSQERSRSGLNIRLPNLWHQQVAEKQGPGAPRTHRNNAKKESRRLLGPSLLPWLLLAGLLILNGILLPQTLNLNSIKLVTVTALPLMLVATGETVVILTGGIDLSVAGVVSLAAVVFATGGTSSSAGAVAWVAITLAIGVVAGGTNGLLIGLLRLPPFVVTLATWSIYGGLALLVLPTPGGNVPVGFTSVLYGDTGVIPNVAFALVLVVGLWLWAKRTRPLRQIYAIGSDEAAALSAGVQPARSLIIAYAVCGLLAAVAGIAYAAETASGDPLGGNPFLLPSVAAVVIGGTPLAGGRGGVVGTIAGAYILTYLANVVFAFGLPSFWTPLIQGLLLVITVALGSARARSGA